MRSTAFFICLTLIATSDRVAYADICLWGSSKNDWGIPQCNGPPAPPLPQLPPIKINPTDSVLPGLAPLREAAKGLGDQDLVAATQTFDAIGEKLEKETRTAINNALTNPDKAVRDAVQTHLKAANDVVDAVRASAIYAERTVQGYGNVLSNADARIRRGKVIDALWHINTDQLTNQNDNSAKFMQESEAARLAAQSAAGLYGGPAGSAAFAAWMAYNTSNKNIEAALRAGAYTYVVSANLANVGSMPSGTVSEVAKKAAATAAVKGLAVAAAGGTNEDILRAAAQGGGSVIIQSGQSYVKKEYVDPAKAKADAFCMHAVNVSCSDAKQWIDESKSRLEEYKAAADSLPNTLPIGDGSWTISWDRKALLDKTSKVPSVVLTYVGEGSPFRGEILKLASLGDPVKFPPVADAPAKWAALRAPGATSFYFSTNIPFHVKPLAVGDILVARTEVNIRPDHSGGGWGNPAEQIKPTEVIKVLEVRIATTKYGPQEWIRFERDDGYYGRLRMNNQP